jgi:uncharacterized membrane protein
MVKILEKMNSAIAAGFVLALIVLLVFNVKALSEEEFWRGLLTVFHVLSGILWIGLLYYFNLVQIPTMPKIPAELKPAVGKYIAPEALFWFRMSAAATVLFGLIVAFMMRNNLTTILSVGMVLGLIMAFNVWFIIWPNQKKALGIVPADDAAKAAAARIAMLTSRTNFVLSVPMLYCMVMSRYGVSGF